MTTSGRKPGIVSDEAEPVGKPIFTRSQNASKAPSRQPGRVNDAAEAISDSESSETINLDEPKVFFESSPWSTAFLLLLIGGLVWLLSEAIISLLALYQYSVFLAVPAIVLFLATLVALVWAGQREFQALRSVDRLSERKESLTIAVEDNDWSIFSKEMEPVLRNIEKREPELIKEYREAIEDGDSVADSVSQFENIVLSTLDDEVGALIKHTVWTTSIGVAAAPHPALDAFLVIWQGQNLSRKIGTIYGLEPTGLSSWRLLRHTLVSAFIAAGVEEFGEISIEKIFEGPAAAVMKPLVESAVMARRMYRLGNLAKNICRP